MMKEKRMISKTILSMSVILLMAVVLMLPSKAAGTKEVTITSDNFNGGKGLQEAFDLQKGDTPQYDSLKVTLAPGTYNLTETLVVYSNTTIEATGATINYVRTIAAKEGYRAPVITNYCVGKGGYTGAGNISINGGTWDMQSKKGQNNAGYSFEAFRFMHGSDFSFTNLTMQNLELSHYITIEGVKNVMISNCTFKDMQDLNTKKEAVHIDIMHNDSMAPSNQDNTIYDDTICNNITVTGCTFHNVPRGVGTHIAVAGLYPSDMVFTNNTFTNITYEAIKAYHYKNVTITGNKITNAGCGIKVYLYAEPEDNDNDDEGNTNYQNALAGVATQGVPSDLATTISNNVIQDITSEKNGFGIHLGGCKERVMNGITVTSNTIKTANKSSSTKLIGIYGNYTNQAVITDNTVSNAGTGGIQLSASTNATITKNNVTSAGQNGILAYDGADVTISSNQITKAGAHSVYTKNTTGLSVNSNTISSDKTGGICIADNCSQAKVTGNQIANSSKNAILVLNAKKVTISSNVCKSPAAQGIYASNAASITLSSNTITGAKTHGIYITKSASANISSNTISKDKTGAICVDTTCTKAKITKNKVTSSGKNGIAVLSSKNVTVSKNTIKKAKNFGIYTTKANNMSITGNTVSDSGSTAIISEKSTGAKVTSNTVTNAGKYGILFNGTVKSSASKNKIAQAKNYSVIYSNNSKNRGDNVKFVNISAVKGKKAVTGHTSANLKVSVSVNGKTKNGKAKSNGDFSIATAKLKKGDKVIITITDKKGNAATKSIKV